MMMQRILSLGALDIRLEMQSLEMQPFEMQSLEVQSLEMRVFRKLVWS